ncbi:hypothetical protein [Desulfobulbus alkaliphilus]|uniref:hypothetical protein n=1 Tax=Desulfobulbus alkaliphilus TaxID=869814 RepID=UPI001966703F|nr:hypothetical protein [Desulfobulbus alkaliphilus]MBM9537063.1 hypothetical protein [Desulfobulbus alkaliphilus]
MAEGSAKQKRRPWWVSALLAIAAYVGLRYLAPMYQPHNPTLAGLLAAGPTIAPVVTMFLLLLAAKQLYDHEPEKKDEDRTDQPPAA